MHLANNLYSWFNSDKMVTGVGQMSDNQILSIANDINGLFSDTSLTDAKVEITLPKIVVVGTQSSGKSSVLNGIMAMDILPTGKNMTTRTPLELRLHQTKSGDTGVVEFGDYAATGWVSEKKISIKTPIPSDSEVGEIRDYIMKKTNEIAGEGMNISSKPIIINIFSPNVPNLSLIDLPGLTMVACVDKGQPIDIKDRIERLVVEYIKQKKTIILAIMQAKSDLETDIGLALIKKYEVSGGKIIGVLTKPDLMNQETTIVDYLTNNISKNLMLTYGYYVVKNRNGQELKDYNIYKGFEIERDYFASHNEYKKPVYKDRVGTGVLTNNLSRILITSITETLPGVMREIMTLEGKINQKIEKFGTATPTSKDGKLSLLNKYVTNYFYNFSDSVESRGTVLNTGKILKDTFVQFRKELNEIKPFTNSKIYNSEYFKNIISSFEGNHMSFHTPPIQILEATMSDNKNKPIMYLRDRCMKCVDAVCEIIINLLKNLSALEDFSQYPLLATHIINYITEEMIYKNKEKCKMMIFDLLKNESEYIWTDNKDFLVALANVSRAQNVDTDQIIMFLESYFNTVKFIIAHSVPKVIMSGLIREMEKSMLGMLLQNVVAEDKINMLKEDDGVEKQRLYYNDIKNRIITIKKNFSKNI